MKNRIPFILEIVWIIVGIVCLAAGISSLINNGGTRSVIFFVMVLISGAFAWIRHNQRKSNN